MAKRPVRVKLGKARGEQIVSALPSTPDTARCDGYGRFVPTKDIKRPERIWSRGILVYPPVLHDNLEVLGGIGDQINILQRVALDQQQIGERALFHDAELP